MEKSREQIEIRTKHIEELTLLLQQKETMTEHLKCSLKDTEKQVAEAKAENLHAANREQGLRSQLEEFISKTHQAEQQFAPAQQEIDMLKRKLTKADTFKAELETSIKEYKEPMIRSLNIMIHEKKVNFQLKQSEAALKEELNLSTATQEELSKVVNQMKRENDQLADAQRQQEAEIQTLKCANEEHVQSITLLTAQKRSLSDDYKKASSQLLALESEISSLKDSCKSYHEKVERLETNPKEDPLQSHKIQNLTEALQQREIDLATSQKTIESLQGETQTMKLQISSHEMELSRLKTDFEKSEKTLQQITSEKEQLQERNRLQEVELTCMKKTHDRTLQKLSEVEGQQRTSTAVDELELKIKDKDGELATLKEKMKHLAHDNETMKDSLDERETQLHELQSRLQTQTRALELKNVELESKNVALSVMQKKLVHTEASPLPQPDQKRRLPHVSPAVAVAVEPSSPKRPPPGNREVPLPVSPSQLPGTTDLSEKPVAPPPKKPRTEPKPASPQPGETDRSSSQSPDGKRTEHSSEKLSSSEIERPHTEKIAIAPVNKSPRVVVNFSGFKDDIPKKDLTGKVQKLGGEVRDTPQWDNSITHVVVPDVGIKTMKAMAARLLKRWVIKKEWVDESIAAGHWLSEEGFGIRSPTVNVGKNVWVSDMFKRDREKFSHAATLMKLCRMNIVENVKQAELALVIDTSKPDPDITCTKISWSAFLDMIIEKTTPKGLISPPAQSAAAPPPRRDPDSSGDSHSDSKPREEHTSHTEPQVAAKPEEKVDAKSNSNKEKPEKPESSSQKRKGRGKKKH
ncbi:hypothetical protein Pelo_13988 [Pelomyxa schiedti]|nr:hypothetical protein Pelo_13988 [Pelomyxa schiedti]